MYRGNSSFWLRDQMDDPDLHGTPEVNSETAKYEYTIIRTGRFSIVLAGVLNRSCRHNFKMHTDYYLSDFMEDIMES